MNTIYIDINCDLGEGIGNEKDIMPLISSCNIACGSHAGDQKTMRKVALMAKKHGVKVGAHPSYPDREHFGRISMEISEKDLIKSIQEQLKTFISILTKEQIPLYHIKPHGALYNDIAKSATLTKTYLKAIAEYRKDSYLYVPFGSVIEKEALAQGFKILREAFADRNYNDDLSLVPRTNTSAILHNPKQVLNHVVRMAKEGKVKTLKGRLVHIIAETFCVHGDTVSALQILDYLSLSLPKLNIYIKT